MRDLEAIEHLERRLLSTFDLEADQRSRTAALAAKDLMLRTLAGKSPGYFTSKTAGWVARRFAISLAFCSCWRMRTPIVSSERVNNQAVNGDASCPARAHRHDAPDQLTSSAGKRRR